MCVVRENVLRVRFKVFSERVRRNVNLLRANTHDHRDERSALAHDLSETMMMMMMMICDIG